MKRIATVVCASALLGWMINVALAHDGTVDITGTITENTCTVSPDSTNFTVEMGSVASKQFYNAGSGSDYKPFVINLEKCSSSITSVTVSFKGATNSLNSDLLALSGGSGYATGIGIGIYNPDKSLIPMDKESELTTLTLNQQAVKLSFYARYIADGAKVSAGTANASATFMLTYA